MPLQCQLKFAPTGRMVMVGASILRFEPVIL